MRRKRLSYPVSTRAIAGVRVSTEEQNARQGPKRQRREILEEAARAGLKIEDWIEESISGADYDRAAENLYYEAVRTTPGLNVFFSTADRVGRHIEVTTGIARTIMDLGGVVWVAGIGSLREGRNWDFFLRDAVDAETDYSRIIRRMHTGKLDKARRGHWAHGQPAWGYKPARDYKGVSTVLEWDTTSAPTTVPLIFSLALSGGVPYIQQQLKARGILSPAGLEHWSTKSIHNLLSNRIYCGSARFADEVIPVPAMITETQFKAAQDALRTRRPGPQANPSSLLVGHLECGVCGATLDLLSGGSRGVKYFYYGCRFRMPSRATRENHAICMSKRTPSKLLEEQVWTYLLEHLASPALLEPILSQGEKVVDHSVEKAALQDTIRRVGIAVAREWLTVSEAEEELKPTRARIKQLQALEKVGPVRVDAVGMAKEFRVALDGIQTLEKKRAFLKGAGVRVRVGPGGIVGCRVRV